MSKWRAISKDAEVFLIKSFITQSLWTNNIHVITSKREWQHSWMLVIILLFSRVRLKIPPSAAYMLFACSAPSHYLNQHLFSIGKIPGKIRIMAFIMEHLGVFAILQIKLQLLAAFRYSVDKLYKIWICVVMRTSIRFLLNSFHGAQKYVYIFYHFCTLELHGWLNYIFTKILVRLSCIAIPDSEDSWIDDEPMSNRRRCVCLRYLEYHLWLLMAWWRKDTEHQQL